MAADYPAAITTTTNPLASDTLGGSTVKHAAQHVDANDEIIAVETALGANINLPTWTNAVVFTNLRTRLATMQVNCKDFGCVGDGTANDGDKMQNFLNYCVITGATGFIPRGRYLMRTSGGAIKRLVLDFTTMGANLEDMRIYGEGPNTSRLIWSDSIGAGLFAFGITNPAKLHTPQLENFSLHGKTAWVDPNATLATTAEGYGLDVANRLHAVKLGVYNFYGGYVVDSTAGDNTDHFDLIDCDAQANFFDFYVANTNSSGTRDWRFLRCGFSRAQRAAVACSNSGMLPDCTFIDCHFNAAPYAFHKEDSADEGLFMDIVHFVRCKAEGSGNYFIYGLGADTNNTHCGGTLGKLSGFVEVHGIEVNGNIAGSENFGSNHTYRPILFTGAITRGAAGDANTSLTTSAAHGINIGDHFGLYFGTPSAPNDNSTWNGKFIAGAGTTGTTLVYRDDRGALTSAATGGSIGKIGGIRCGNAEQWDLTLSLQGRSDTPLDPEASWEFYMHDNLRVCVLDADHPPSIDIRRAAWKGNDANVLFEVGAIRAYHAKADGTFAAGDQLEVAANGAVIKSTVTMAIPWAGMAIQPAATVTAVAGNVASRKWAWVQTSGPNRGGGGNVIGPGANTAAAAQADAKVLMEDPASAGDVITWDATANVRRIIGRSIKTGASNFVDVWLEPAYMIKA